MTERVLDRRAQRGARRERLGRIDPEADEVTATIISMPLAAVSSPVGAGFG
jgi:hypothetical protein